jgi:DnaJ-class molecular chaperone
MSGSKIIQGARDALAYAKGGTDQARVLRFYECEHCDGSGMIEPDNNGAIGSCPICEGDGWLGEYSPGRLSEGKE